MSESPYLKDELGPLLAKGLAAVAIARPQDPVEYLALWLMHQQQKKDAKAAEVECARVLEAEREDWAKARAVREKMATGVIQREWRAHVTSQADVRRKEADLKLAFAKLDDIADEKFPEEPLSEGDKSEQERGAEGDRLAAQQQFGKARLYCLELDKSIVADFKTVASSNAAAMTTLKCVFYLMGLRPKQLDSASKIKSLVKPHPFAAFMHGFQPCGTPIEKKRKITRVRRLLTTVDEEAVKESGAALYAVFSWLTALTQFRDLRDDHVKILKAAGKETEEELDEEEEDDETAEKDEEEEVVKAAEMEAKRIADAEAAEEEAENAGEAAEE